MESRREIWYDLIQDKSSAAKGITHMTRREWTNDLLANLDKIHTTELGVERIRKNLGLDVEDVVSWCREQIESSDSLTRTGKNWYVRGDGFVITVNAHSYTIITAHRR
jgi:hypothetical protein